jgi:hypothetical protein
METLAALQTVEIEFDSEAARKAFLAALERLQEDPMMNALSLPLAEEAMCDLCACTL